MTSNNNPAKYCFVFDDFRNNTLGSTVAFSLSNNSEINFELFYKQNCNISTHEGTFTTIYLYLESCNKEQVSIDYRLSIGSGKNVKSQEGQETFSISKQMRYGAEFNINQNYLLNPNTGLITKRYEDGKWVEKLEICCEIKEIVEIKNNLKSLISSQDMFIENLKTLLETGKYADAVRIVGDKKLRVHKNILAARSKVFSAMFEHDCEEKKQNRVEITDIQLDVCEELLRYMYTGKIETMSKLALELLIASDKYELEELKYKCEEYLKRNLSIKTVADILLLADLHQANELRAKCIDFISENGEKVKNTSGWKLLKNKSGLTAELFLKLTEKFEKLKKNKSEETISNRVCFPYSPREKLKHDFKKLIENDEKFCDVVIILKNGELKAHKNILAVRSKVFEKIFEQEQNRIELQDVSVQVCKQLLRYIYTDAVYNYKDNYDYGNFPLDDAYATELLMLSEKYELSDLKTRSERKISETLSIDTVSSTLLLADKHNASNLKEKCIEYITANCRQVTQTEEWKNLTKSKPELLVDLYERIAAKQWY